MSEQEQRARRNLLEMHHEHLLERAEQCERIAKACRAVVDTERARFAYLWDASVNSSSSPSL
jgi:hypothetical protein